MAQRFRKLGLDVRVVNALAAQGIVALEDLVHITPRELASFRGIGPSTRKLLQDYLKKEKPEPAIPLVLPAEFLRAIDDWRLTHDDAAPSRTDAIRSLVEIGLATLKKANSAAT